MAEIETVKIKGGEGEPAVITINAEDYDEAVHALATEKDLAAAAASQPVATETATEGEELMKHTKAELVTIATEKGIEIVPDELNKQQIVDKILAAK